MLILKLYCPICVGTLQVWAKVLGSCGRLNGVGGFSDAFEL